jgi:hypothetical protein
MTRTACLVCLISTVSGCSKKREKKNQKCSASSMHTTKLEQSISLDIYGHKTVITIQMSN